VAVSKNECYFLVLLFLSSIVGSCSSKNQTEVAQGDVIVQIPMQTSSSSYELKTVTLQQIQDLRHVSGGFAQFFYSPGATDSTLTGSAPVAHFAQKGATFYPLDYISAQMAAIYYHMQSLTSFNQKVNAADVNVGPRVVGLEARVFDNNREGTNNAFYDGSTDAMVFEPFTNTDLAISLNAGIIAHEYFHSLFFKLVLKQAYKNKKIITSSASIHGQGAIEFAQAVTKLRTQTEESDQDAALLNEAYLRGINEGLADFWGWVYTEDVNFMKWSLPSFVGPRVLTLSESDIGRYETKAKIRAKIEEFKAFSSEVHNSIIGYSYQIGTPHARFLKQLVTFEAGDLKIPVSEAKVKVASEVIEFLHSIQRKVTALKDGESMEGDEVFQFFADKNADNKALGDKTCQFLTSYLGASTSAQKSKLTCAKKDEVVKTTTPSADQK